MKNKRQKRLSAIVMCMLCCGYAAAASAAENNVPSGQTMDLTSGTQLDTAYRASGAGTILRAQTGNSVTLISAGHEHQQYGVVHSLQGGKLQFAAGSVINVTKNAYSSRSTYVGDGSTGDFSGEINSTNNTADTRNFHIDDKSNATFHVGSTTNVITTGNNTYGFAVSLKSNANVYGDIVVTMDATCGTGATLNGSDLGIDGRATGLMVGWNAWYGENATSEGTSASLHLGKESATAAPGTISVTTNSNMVTAGVVNGSTFIADAGTTVTLANNYAGQTTLFNSGAQVTLNGNVSITAANPTSNAIYMQSNSGKNLVNYVTKTTIGNGTGQVNITGAIRNIAGKSEDELNIVLGTAASSITGSNYLTNDGRLTNITLNNGSAWLGDNNVNTTATDGTVNINVNSGSDWGAVANKGNNIVTKGNNNITVAGIGSTWHGDSTLHAGANKINIGTLGATGDTATWTGDNIVLSTNAADTNIVTVASDGEWYGNSTLSGQNSKNVINIKEQAKWTGNSLNNGENSVDTINLEANAEWNGSNTTNTAVAHGGTTKVVAKEDAYWTGTNAVHNGTMAADFSGNAHYNGSNTVNSADSSHISSMTWDLKDDALVESVANVTGSRAGTVGESDAFLGVYAYDNSTWQGNVNQTNGTANLFFTEGSHWVGDATINGKNVIHVYDQAKWDGKQNVNGGIAYVNVDGDDAVWTGDATVSAGTDSIYLDKQAKWDGNGEFKGTSKSDITVNGSAQVDGNLTVSAVTGVATDKALTFAAYDNAQFNGDLLTTGGNGTAMEFYGNSSWNDGANRLSGVSDVDITITDNAKLNNVANIISCGTNKITATGNAQWLGDNTITNAGNNTIDFAGSSIWTGNNYANDEDTDNQIVLSDTAKWVGNNSASGTGVNDIIINDNGKWAGMSSDSHNYTNLNLNGAGTWCVTGTSNIGTVNASEGTTIDMVHNIDNVPLHQYDTLTINNLNGSGTTFKLETDLDKAVIGVSTITDGDKLVVNNATDGSSFYLQVADESLYTGTEITGNRKLLVATDNSQNLTLNLVGQSLDQGGLWQVNPPELFRGEGDDAHHWYLGYVEKDVNKDTFNYLIDRQVAVYNQWARMYNDSLRKRLGDLRYNTQDDGGIWVRYNNGKLKGSGYKQDYNTIQLGVDKTNGHSTYGVALDRQSSSQNYKYGSGDGSTVSGSIYYSNYSDTGTYFDSIIKYGTINSEYYTRGNYPDHADYDTQAYSMSMEYGKTNRYDNGYFVEPKVQLTYGHITAETYTTDRGTTIKESAIKTLVSKLGVTMGRQINKDTDYYIKAGWFKEFKGDRDVSLVAANGEKMSKSFNYGDSWFEVGVGGNIRINDAMHLYGDIEKSFGGDTVRTFQVNAGVRWEF